jgi:hypothetical protein
LTSTSNNDQFNQKKKREIGKIRRIREKFGIPRSGLEDWLYGRSRSCRWGKVGILSTDKEYLIVEWIYKPLDMGWPLTNLDLNLKVCIIT